MRAFFNRRVEHSGDEEITPIADIMSGLMVIFLFISVSYMSQVHSISAGYYKVKNSLYQELAKEFDSDLRGWNAEIDKETLTIRFRELDILFDRGQSRINKRFQAILQDFIPRYVNVLYSKQYRSQIEEVRVEGHTSSEGAPWEGTSSAYLSNMKLSQDRSRAVLGYSLSQLWNPNQAKWLRSVLTANGLSSKSPILEKGNRKENPELSRRVEFRVRVKSEETINKLLKGDA